MTALRDMATMSLADIAQTAHISFEQWLRPETFPRRATTTSRSNRSQTGQADLNLTPARDVLGHIATAAIKMNP